MANEVRRPKVEAALLPASAANDGGQRSIAGRRTNVTIYPNPTSIVQEDRPVKWFAIVAFVAGIGFIVAFIVVVWLIVRALPG